MKIEDLTQKPPVVPLVTGRADKPEPAEAQGEAVGKQSAGMKPQPGADKVDFSGNMSSLALQVRQDQRASRIEEIKSQIASGNYQVSGKAVAEKMLSKIVIS